MTPKQIPTLFQPDMVRAILREIEAPGTGKTTTRRVLKQQPEDLGVGDKPITEVADYCTNAPEQGKAYYWRHKGCWNSSKPFKLPYAVGDLLWAREAWRTDQEYDEVPPRDVPAKAPLLFECDDAERKNSLGLWGRYRHGRFMCCWMSRLTLEVMAVKVERLQDISEEDAKAEGTELERNSYLIPNLPPCDPPAHRYATHRRAFADLWNSINAKPTPNHATIDGNRQIVSYTSYPWEDGVRTETHRGKPHYIFGNPWVVAPSFVLHLANIDDFLKQREAA